MTTKTSAVMVGLAIGDALGMPYETLDETVHDGLATWDGSFQPGTFHNLPRGHFTDDTEMATCLAESLVANHGFVGEDVAARYLRWSQGTPHGMGGTTRSAMRALHAGASWENSGVVFVNPEEVGSGPAMRCAPLGAQRARTVTEQWLPAVCFLDAAITHVHPEAYASSMAIAMAVNLAADDWPPSPIIIKVLAALCNMHDGESTLVYQELKRVRDAIQSGKPFTTSCRGNARSITSSAIYCALSTRSFRDGVVAAVKLGGDADTRGAIAGAILGARFGLEGIPEEYTFGEYKAGEYRPGVKDFARLAALDRALVESRP